MEKNKERRLAREKGKGVHFDGAADDVDSPSSPAPGTTKAAGTQRKCANCGQIGHIKTNKKCDLPFLFIIVPVTSRCCCLLASVDFVLPTLKVS